jgi:hypothetical protein
MRVIEGYEPDFDLDLRYGKEAERQFLQLLGSPETIEVKRDRIAARTWRLYVEYAQRSRATGQFVPSGILKTAATHWAYRIETRLGAMTFVIPVPALKALVDELFLEGSLGGEEHGDCPTWGVLVPIRRLLVPHSPDERKRP